MSSGDEAELIQFDEFARRARAKEPAAAAWGALPALDVLRIGPHEVAQRTFDWHFNVAR